MTPNGAWTWYPRGQNAMGQIGPSFQTNLFAAIKPATIVAEHPKEKIDIRPQNSGFTANKFIDAYAIKQAVGFKQEPAKNYFNPTLTPLANFSVPVEDAVPTKSVNLSDDIDTRTENLKGMQLLTALMNYVKKVNVFTLNVKEFESVLKACERLNLSPDPQKAGLKAEYDQNISDNDFYKLELWLLATPSTDPAIKKGFIRIMPGNTLSACTALVLMPLWKFYTAQRLARTPVEIKTLADVEMYGNAVDDEAEDIGLTLPNLPSAPNLATGRDGDVSTGPATDFPDPEVDGRVLQREALDIVVQSARDAVDARRRVQEEVKDPTIDTTPTIGRAIRTEPKQVPFTRVEKAAVEALPEIFDLTSFQGMTAEETLDQWRDEGNATIASLINRRRKAGFTDRKTLFQINEYLRLNPPLRKKTRTKGKSIKDRD